MTSKGRSLSQQLSSAISTSRDEGEFTDLVLNHEAGCFKVHRIIVCPQSGVFQKACSGGFKEASTGTIEMMDISYLELTKMVAFFYSMDYDDDVTKAAEKEAPPHIYPLQLHARMFALGDRYDIPGLRDVALQKYCHRCVISLEPLEFLESIYDVYERTPASIRELRNAALVLMRRKLPKMLDDKAVATVYETVLIELPEFTRDMLEIYVKAPLRGDCSTCGSNQAFESLQVRCKRCGKGQSALYRV